MKCNEILKIYQLYVDEELDESAQKELKKHVNECNNCQTRVKFEMRFKMTITRKAKSTTRNAPDDLRERIMQKIK